MVIQITQRQQLIDAIWGKIYDIQKYDHNASHSEARKFADTEIEK